jgi:hypothetical protein
MKANKKSKQYKYSMTRTNTTVQMQYELSHLIDNVGPASPHMPTFDPRWVQKFRFPAIATIRHLKAARRGLT